VKPILRTPCFGEPEAGLPRRRTFGRLGSQPSGRA
jgi:hypothetical protein